MPGVGVAGLRQQGGDAHHLSALLSFLESVLLRRQLDAENDGRNHEDGGQRSQGGNDDEAVLHQASGGAGLGLSAGGALCDMTGCCCSCCCRSKC